MTGLLGSFAAALKQLQPRLQGELAPLLGSMESPAGVAGNPKAMVAIAAQHAPSLCVLWTVCVLTATHSGPPDELLFAVNGVFCAWFYLRFYQPHPGAPSGDAGDAFGFATLFPPPLRPPIRLVANATYAFFSTCGLCPPVGWGADPSGGAGGSLISWDAQSFPGTMGGSRDAGSVGAAMGIELLASPLPPTPSVTTADPEVAERRRERARALIEARLASKQGAAGTPATPATPGSVAARP